MTDDVINHDFTPPHPRTLGDMPNRHCETWETGRNFGVSHLIWATGSHTTPEPPSPPTGGSPAAANVGSYTKLRVAA